MSYDDQSLFLNRNEWIAVFFGRATTPWVLLVSIFNVVSTASGDIHILDTIECFSVVRNTLLPNQKI